MEIQAPGDVREEEVSQSDYPEPPGFDVPKLWSLTVRLRHDNPKYPSQLWGRQATYGIVALSLDEAIEVLRKKFPNARLEGATMSNESVHFVVHDPEAIRVYRRLTGEQ